MGQVLYMKSFGVDSLSFLSLALYFSNFISSIEDFYQVTLYLPVLELYFIGYIQKYEYCSEDSIFMPYFYQ